ncbi:MAG TPA: hypothetical protein VMM36_19330 [Opitutaceae bacterium]|nr:hypothetical protein [Opitutaceae bacterium]
MEIALKVLAAVLTAGAIVLAVVFLERRIARRADARWQLFARSLLYAFAFTPTAYHHAPNTIIAPLHLSTICGNLFYGYDYTAGMFLYGVALPIACGWAVVGLVLAFRMKPHTVGLPII